MLTDSANSRSVLSSNQFDMNKEKFIDNNFNITLWNYQERE